MTLTSNLKYLAIFSFSLNLSCGQEPSFTEEPHGSRSNANASGDAIPQFDPLLDRTASAKTSDASTDKDSLESENTDTTEGLESEATDNQFTCSVDAGADIVGTAGQEVVVIVKAPLSRDFVSSINLSSPYSELMQTKVLADFDSEFIKEFRFVVPPLAPYSEHTLEATLQTSLGNECTDSLQLNIKPLEAVGDEQLYSWDLRLFAEHQQPADQIPEVSIFDVQSTRDTIDALVSENPPYPVLLQPQTSIAVGVKEIEASCSMLMPGEGHCVAFEDWLTPASDRDYDHLFGAKPEAEKLTIFANRVTDPGARNKTDLLLTHISDDVELVKVQIFRRVKALPEEEFSEVYAESSHEPEEQSVRINLWMDQKVIFDHGGNERELKIVVSFERKS